MAVFESAPVRRGLSIAMSDVETFRLWSDYPSAAQLARLCAARERFEANKGGSVVRSHRARIRAKALDEFAKSLAQLDPDATPVYAYGKSNDEVPR